jgi:hypothetical protein
MKYLKMLALAAVAAGALMAFIGASTASAAVICSTTADPCPAGQKWPAETHIKFTAIGSLLLKETGASGNTLDTCTGGTVAGKLTNAGGAGVTATGPVETLTWSGCSLPTNTLVKGKLEVKKIAGTSNGTIVADGEFQVTINTVFFGSCIYGVTSGNSLGDLTEGKGQTATEGGEPAIFHANAVAERFSGSNVVCPETSNWTGTYQLTEPVGTTASISNE